MIKKLLAITAVWAVCISCFADLKLSSLFTDNMVLQRDQKVPVWGWTEPDADVTVVFAGDKKQVKAGSDGKFVAYLEAKAASALPRPLTVQANGKTIEIKNVLVGEVWLCSGQSNMHFPAVKMNNYEQEKKEADYPQIRMFRTELSFALEPQNDMSGDWVVCTPQQVRFFSAVAYFFGRELHRELKVPVGLIRSCWPGTRIEAWTPLDAQKDIPAAVEYKAYFDGVAQTFDEAREEVRFEKALVAWEKKVAQAQASGQKPPKKPKKKEHPYKNRNYPAMLYNGMIHPLVPYGIRGAIWYQGEGNGNHMNDALAYRDLLESMASEWRSDWGTTFPFYAVQLPNYEAPQTKPVEDTPWPFLRDGMLNFHKEVPGAGIAVTIDVGEAGNIHPKNKKPFGQRLAHQALAHTYGKDVVPGGPIYRSMRKEGQNIIIHFDDIGSGLTAQGGEPLKRFAIAGEDRKFVEAEARIVGDTVVVSSEKVADPVAVRYAWAKNPSGCNLFNNEGFPASPFRTDDWPPKE